ncbi:hypothetical protein J2Z60_001851 [Lactobacillus colini]|uniref:Uncharacterized protein n=1 Tax=Lactobacillus colini TaxID=1819254 RepID=A0ABS4MGD7_9LACO|nr:hypothetical protein [Lactobacillus colini]MBP2058663.1 hypothetical protein [Lactobacillus colini]
MMDSEQELIESTIYLLTDSVISVNSAFQSDEFQRQFAAFSLPQKLAYYTTKMLVDSTITFGKEAKPSIDSYNTMIDNTDGIQEFIVHVVEHSDRIPQFEFFSNFYNYYKKIQTSLNS